MAFTSVVFVASVPAFGQNSAFTYQGKLESAGQPVDVPMDFRFRLFDAATGGNQIYGAFVFDVPVVRGLFSAELPILSNPFAGADYWLDVAVRDGSIDNANQDPLTFMTLSPRQQIRPTPYAFYSRAGSATQLQGRPLSAAAPATGQVLKYNGAQWAPAADADTTYTAGAGLQLSGTTFAIPSSGVTNGMIASSAVGTPQIAAGAVGSVEIADNSVGPVDLNLNALGLYRVTGGQMQANSTSTTAITIGPSAPFSNPLTVFAAGTASGGVTGSTEVMIRARSTTVATHSAIAVDAQTGQDAIVYLGDNGAAAWGIRSDSSDAHKLNVRSHVGSTNNTRLTITTSGEVGIGTTSPTARLHVAGTAGTDGIRFPDGSLQVRAARMLRGNTGMIDIPALGAGASISVNFGFPGATVGSGVLVSPLSDLGSGLVMAMARVQSADSIQFRVQNVSAATIDPPPMQFAIVIFE